MHFMTCQQEYVSTINAAAYKVVETITHSRLYTEWMVFLSRVNILKGLDC